MARRKIIFGIILLMIGLSLLSACSPVESTSDLPQVVASTTIVGDVVSQVGADLIDLRVLLPVDADPHSFSPAPRDAAMVESADLVFLNGFNLEESLAEMIETNATGEIVYISDGITPLQIGNRDHEDEDEHEEEEGQPHTGDDPHVWLDPQNVEVWVENIAAALSELDPDHSADYRANADAYLTELADLNTWALEKVAQIPAEQRVLVTDHESLGYFAEAYGFSIEGVIVPGGSTLAEPSAQEIAALETAIESTGTLAIFVGSTVNTQLAERIAADTGAALVPLYTGSLSAADGPASNYLDLMRYDIKAVVEALAGN